MTQHEHDDVTNELLEDLDVSGEESEHVKGGCQNNLAQTNQAATGRVAKVDALVLKQNIG